MTVSMIVFLAVIIIIMVSISWPNFAGAPFVPTSMGLVNKMLTMADVGPEDTVYDLGCGDGRTIITAARKYGAQAVGIEIDPLRYIWCQVIITILGLRGRVKVLFGDFFRHDLNSADVVICYLLQDTNNKLEEKFLQELPYGARVVSNYFLFPNLNKVREDGDARMYLLFSENDLKIKKAISA